MSPALSYIEGLSDECHQILLPKSLQGCLNTLRPRLYYEPSSHNSVRHKMIGEEKSIISNEEINEEGQRVIPAPEIVKDFALAISTFLLLISVTVAFLGAWRRRIVQEDQMTREFKDLMKRGNNLAKEE